MSSQEVIAIPTQDISNEPAAGTIQPDALSKSYFALKTEYESLCQHFKTTPNARIQCIINNAITNNAPTIRFDLSSPGLRNEDKITDSMIVPLFEAFQSSNCAHIIESVDLSFNRVSDSGAKSCAAFLNDNRFIQSINLKGNDITIGGRAIVNIINSTSLQSLNLSGNALGDEVIVLLSKQLTNHSPTDSSLTTLDIGHCNFGHLGWTHLMGRMADNTSIQTLNVENCRIDKGLSHEMHTILSRMLQQNRTLKSLNMAFQGDGIGDEGMKWISEALRGNHVLETLDLSCNRISADGIRYLSEILSKSKRFNDENETCSVQKLILRGNRITDEGARYLCQCIESNETLTYLDLRGTKLSDEGLFRLAQTAFISKSRISGLVLRTLLLDGNEFGSKSRAIWRRVVEERDSKVLHYDFWPLIV